MDEKTEPSSKTASIKEIHSVEKTKVLLLRDLPFITWLSKFYDLSLSNTSLSNKSSNFTDNKLKPIPNFLEKEHNDRKDLNQVNIAVLNPIASINNDK